MVLIKTFTNIFIVVIKLVCIIGKNLESVAQVQTSTENFDNIQDLFSVILYKGISHQLKRGLNREYEEKQEQLYTI